MTLTREEYNDFLKIQLDLLLFVGIKLKTIPGDTTMEVFKSLDLQIKFQCREGLHNNEDIPDEYIASNFDHLTSAQPEIVTEFNS